MKLSKEAIEVFHNFAEFNNSMLFLEGTTQRSIHKMMTIFGEVELEDDFPKEFAVYDMSIFLGVLSLFKEPDLTFDDTTVYFNEGDQKATYRYCNPALIIAPPKDKKLVEGDIKFSFELSAEHLKLILKAVALFDEVEHIAFEADGESIYIRTMDVKKASADGFSYKLGECDQKFLYVLNISNVTILKHSYDVSITESLAVILRSKQMKLKYVIPCDAEFSGDK